MKRALIGYGGHAREVMAQIGEKLPCFVDDKYVTEETIPLSEFNPDEFLVMIAVANSLDRFNIVNKLPKKTKFFSWVHPTALILKDVEIGEGSFIGANSIVTTNIKLGKHCILNRSNHIGHDCVIGDFFSAMPGSIVSGNVTIDERVYLGTNSSIKEKIKVTSDVTIGLNSGVIKDVKEPGVYVGTPSIKIK
jgi:sugar O-acyltransferase (sialic acid O-acetyltransferase NeuD family)